jgi:pectinesterase
MSINETLKNCNDGDVIILEPGIYKEKVEIYKNNISIIGLDKTNTIITNNDYYHKIMNDYNECNTFRTYTLYVGGNDVLIKNLIIENSSIPSRKYGQAVALHVTGNNFKCNECIIRSAQDTIFTGPLPKDLIERHKDYILNPLHTKGTPSKQHYHKCTIIGDVDFIFGSATAFFEECNLHSVARIKNNNTEPDGYICAPSHPKELEYGYLFYKCTITSEGNVNNVFLGRPWRDYGCAAFIDCTMDNHINPLGFDKWGNTNRDKTARFFEYTENTNLTHREPWVNILNKSEALIYFDNFINFFKKSCI